VNTKNAKKYGHKTNECRLPKYDKKTNISHNKKEWKKKKT
jgi:hypothetical protein